MKVLKITAWIVASIAFCVGVWALVVFGVTAVAATVLLPIAYLVGHGYGTWLIVILIIGLLMYLGYLSEKNDKLKAQIVQLKRELEWKDTIEPLFKNKH